MGVGSVAQLWGWLRDYLGIARRGRRAPVVDTAGLQHFFETRASHVAQTALYGYVRTRAGTRFPELFQDDAFVVSLNIAKWQIWLACLSDLAVYAGGLIAQRVPGATARAGEIVKSAVDGALANAGTPEDAGTDFAAGVEKLRERLARIDWAAVTDDDAPFSESPGALVEWAPVVDELKRLDTEIVENSVRYRWQQVRRDLRRDLDANALLDAAT